MLKNLFYQFNVLNINYTIYGKVFTVFDNNEF